VVRHGYLIKTRVLIAIVGAFLIGCAVFLVGGGSGVRAEHSKEQGHSRGAASEEDRCEGTRGIVLMGGGYATNDVPGCPNGGLLLGTDGPNTGMDSPMQDYLYGGDGEDEVRGLGANDELYGGLGSDVIYGGPGFDMMFAGSARGYEHDTSKNKLYGGDGTDDMFGAEGEDVLYGGDGNDYLHSGDRRGVIDTHRDKLYCGEGRDDYFAGRLDYVDSSCEEGKLVDTGGPPLILFAGAALLLSSGLVMSRYLIRRAS